MMCLAVETIKKKQLSWISSSFISNLTPFNPFAKPPTLTIILCMGKFINQIAKHLKLHKHSLPDESLIFFKGRQPEQNWLSHPSMSLKIVSLLT